MNPCSWSTSLGPASLRPDRLTEFGLACPARPSTRLICLGASGTGRSQGHLSAHMLCIYAHPLRSTLTKSEPSAKSFGDAFSQETSVSIENLSVDTLSLFIQHFLGGTSCAWSERLDLRASIVAQAKLVVSNANNKVVQRAGH